MPDRYGNITGQDFSELANVARGITRDRNVAEDRATKAKNIEDRGLGFASKESPPPGASEAFRKGFTSKGLLDEQDRKSQFNTEVSTAKNEFINAGIKKGFRDPETGFYKQGILTEVLTNAPKNKNEMASKAITEASTKKNPYAYYKARQSLALDDLNNEKAEQELFDLNIEKGKQGWANLTNYSKAIDIALSNGDNEEADRLTIAAGNEAFPQWRYEKTKEGGIVKKYYIDGKLAETKPVTAPEVSKEIKSLSQEKYSREFAASYRAANEANRNPSYKYFKDKAGNSVIAENKVYGDGSPTTWSFWDKNNKPVVGKDGQPLTRLDDWRNAGLTKTATPPTREEALAGKKQIEVESQNVIKNWQAVYKNVNTAVETYMQNTFPSGVGTKEERALGRQEAQIQAMSDFGYPAVATDEKTGETFYRDPKSDGIIDFWGRPVNQAEPNGKKKITPPAKKDTGGKKIKGLKKPPPKDLEGLSKIAKKGIGVLTPYKDKKRTSAGVELLKGIGITAKKVGKAISTSAKETELMIAIGKSGISGGLMERAKMAENLRKKYVNYTEKELVEMVKKLGAKK